MEDQTPGLLGELPPKSIIIRTAYREQARYLAELRDELVHQQKRRAIGLLVLKVLLGATVVAGLIHLALTHGFKF